MNNKLAQILSIFLLGLSLLSCGDSAQESALNSEDSELRDEQSAALHDRIVADLRAKHKGAEDVSWFESRGTLAPTWLVQSPEDYWGQSLEDLPHDFKCKKKDKNCDHQFLRRLCRSDADCSESGTRCEALAASVSKPGQKPRAMCLTPGDRWLDRSYLAMIKAQRHLDLTSLSTPTGIFREAVINALSFLSHQNSQTTVRLLYAADNNLLVAVLRPIPYLLFELMRDVAFQGGRIHKLKVNLGWLNSPKLSWNHTKIIIADQKHVLQGGHNLWDADYLGEKPVFDLSMEVSGDVGVKTQKFVNTLWSSVGYSWAGHRSGFHKIAVPLRKTPASEAGNARMIGAGRLGAFGDNAADSAIISLIEASQRSLLISQQDLFTNYFNKPDPSYAQNAIVDAVLRGVRVQVVQSNQSGGVEGYGMIETQKAFNLLRAAVRKEARRRGLFSANDGGLDALICGTFAYASFRFNSEADAWTDGSAFANHAKLIIADDVSFYLGAQNLYPSNLQEFGLIVSDPVAVDELKKQYWNPLWEHSSRRQVDCN